MSRRRAGRSFSNGPADDAGKREPAVAPWRDKASQQPIAQAVDVSKAFGGVHALCEVSLDLLTGEIHALSGFYAPDPGAYRSMANHCHPAFTPPVSEASALFIHQESVACFDLDAVDSIFVSRERR